MSELEEKPTDKRENKLSKLLSSNKSFAPGSATSIKIDSTKENEQNNYEGIDENKKDLSALLANSESDIAKEVREAKEVSNSIETPSDTKDSKDNSTLGYLRSTASSAAKKTEQYKGPNYGHWTPGGKRRSRKRNQKKSKKNHKKRNPRKSRRHRR